MSAAAAAMAIQAAGSILKGAAGFQAGKANAKMARREAASAIRGGVAQEDEIRMRARRAAGEAITAMAANGVQIGTGSALEVLREIEIESGLDRLRARADAQTRALGLRMQARNYRRQGAWELLGGFMGAAGHVATGVAASSGGGGG